MKNKKNIFTLKVLKYLFFASLLGISPFSFALTHQNGGEEKTICQELIERKKFILSRLEEQLETFRGMNKEKQKNHLIQLQNKVLEEIQTHTKQFPKAVDLSKEELALNSSMIAAGTMLIIFKKSLFLNKISDKGIAALEAGSPLRPLFPLTVSHVAESWDAGKYMDKVANFFFHHDDQKNEDSPTQGEELGPIQLENSLEEMIFNLNNQIREDKLCCPFYSLPSQS